MRSLSGVVILAVITIAAFAGRADAQSTALLAQYSAQLEALRQTYRVDGRIDRDRLVELARGLDALVRGSSGETRARALLELGTVQRMHNDFRDAVTTLSRAAEAANPLRLRDVTFEAWIGIARAHELGTSDHRAAAVAFERALDAAGEQPTAKQRADLANYRAQLEIGRGETEAGLVDALQAVSNSADPKDRFYAELNLADGLQKLAESCDYRPLIDARSSDDGADAYAACRRAVDAARLAYERAAATAATLGWTHLVNEMRRFQSGLNLRRLFINENAKYEAPSRAEAFHPHSMRDVLVSRQFEAGASTLTRLPALATLAESAVADAQARTGRQDARSAYLLGLIKDIRGAGPEEAARSYAAAAELLGAERGGFFDLRRRGTIIENRAEIMRDLAVRLLALRREAEAFAAFESVRARGLSEVASTLARADVTAKDRVALADLVVLEARAGAVEKGIVAEMVANKQLDASAEKLRELDNLRADRRARLLANETAVTRFASTATPSASLDALRAAASRAGIPVLMYWIASGNVIVWYVGSEGSDVRSVFLPASALKEKIDRVLSSSGGSFGQQPYDETAARELFMFLLGPFAAQLNSAAIKEIMIVPQGPLVRLPFEALVDPTSGASVIDRWAISYAPNAALAIAALQEKARPVRTVAAMIDPSIDDITQETAAIRGSGAQVRTVTRNELFSGSWRTDGLHVLTHGEFDPTEALLSNLNGTRRSDPPILAAELLALPLRGLRLAVLSACKGGQVGERISGEIYGFPWALLAGGTAAVVLSRWDVNGDSNGQWMSVFYRELSGGAPAAVGAATAMREMRKSGLVHPYYWAAMQVSGR
jgi:CHAT domain-containing protein